MLEAILKKTNNVFYQVSGTEVPNGEYKAKLTRPRNIMFHKKFFALIRVAWENSDFEHYMSQDQFRKELTIEAGYYNTYTNLDGSEVKEVKSLSFGSMDDTEFTEVYSRVFDVITQKVLVGIQDEELEIQVMQFI